MADKCRGAVSMTPIVSIIDDLDGDGLDVIHHDVKKTLGGKLQYVKTSEEVNARWFYSASSIISSNANLIAYSNFTDGAGPTVAADEVRFIFIKHLGHDGADPKVASIEGTDFVFFTLDGGVPTSQLDAICLDSGESIILKFKQVNGVSVDLLHAQNASANVAVQVLAMIDDGT